MIKYVLSLFTIFFIGSSLNADEKKLTISASIIPIQSFIAMVSEGVNNNIEVILSDSSVSPHDAQINFQETKLINDSNIIFAASKHLETNIVTAVNEETTTIVYLDQELKDLLEPFDETTFTTSETHAEHDHETHVGHDHSNVNDYHIWLDPSKAKAILYVIANKLAEIDPTNKEVYTKNADKYSVKMDNLKSDFLTNLSSLNNFMVYHNAWGYLIRSNNLQEVYKGVIMSNEAGHSHVHTSMSAKNIIDLQNYIQKEQVSCIFIEPQFDDETIKSFAEKNNIKLLMLDPIGEKTDDLINNYFLMIENNVTQLQLCK